LETTWLPADIGRRLAHADLATRDIFLIIENDCGTALGHATLAADAVPADAPPGTNQTYASGATAAEYRWSRTSTFTKDVPVLPAGQRLQTLGATCAVDQQGAVHCRTAGNHGFILSADHGVLW
ncbi:MAG TPA: hypothetical protein PLS04_04655, partial [Mycobacterium sp.]|nr:hypothetical protein [Mycobacterium sp.]